MYAAWQMIAINSVLKISLKWWLNLSFNSLCYNFDMPTNTRVKQKCKELPEGFTYIGIRWKYLSTLNMNRIVYNSEQETNNRRNHATGAVIVSNSINLTWYSHRCRSQIDIGVIEPKLCTHLSIQYIVVNLYDGLSHVHRLATMWTAAENVSVRPLVICSRKSIFISRNYNIYMISVQTMWSILSRNGMCHHLILTLRNIRVLSWKYLQRVISNLVIQVHSRHFTTGCSFINIG